MNTEFAILRELTAGRDANRGKVFTWKLWGVGVHDRHRIECQKYWDGNGYRATDLLMCQCKSAVNQ